MTVQAAFAETLADEWARWGLTQAVVSPGSRSTPLVLALERHAGFRVHVRLDERSAGFFALGLGLATGRPALVVTTSGTAAVEAHAAVVEAHHAHVPLIVCTADRPPELRGTGAPQTIDQHGIFGSALRWGADPGLAAAESRSTWRSLASRAVIAALHHPEGPGPVHLNLPFREPLVGEAEPGEVPPGRPGDARWHDLLRSTRSPAPGALDELQAILGRPTRGLFVAGEGCNCLGEVAELAASLGWPVIADPRARERVPSPVLVASADALVRGERFAAAQRPEVVVRLGAPPASKALAAWLAESGVAYVVVDDRWPFRDPEAVATQVVVTTPGAGVAALAQVAASGAARADDEWLRCWQLAEAAAQGAIEDVLAEPTEPTEPAMARAIYSAVEAGSILFTSSSMPVRDLEWFARPRLAPPTVLANRGASGIDGVTSTALGVAAGAPGSPLTAIVGDLAFLHDLSALVWGDEGPPPATVVVIDNGGGAIFSFLPQATALEAVHFERLFATPQRVDPAALAAAAGFEVLTPATVGELAGIVSRRPEALRVVVVRTDREANVAIHNALSERIADAVCRALGT